MYPVYRVDAQGQPAISCNLPSASIRPVKAFWSIIMYDLPQSLQVANPINRYLINSPMLPDMQKDTDGGLTIYIQNESPGKDK